MQPLYITKDVTITEVIAIGAASAIVGAAVYEFLRRNKENSSSDGEKAAGLLAGFIGAVAMHLFVKQFK